MCHPKNKDEQRKCHIHLYSNSTVTMSFFKTKVLQCLLVNETNSLMYLDYANELETFLNKISSHNMHGRTYFSMKHTITHRIILLIQIIGIMVLLTKTRDRTSNKILSSILLLVSRRIEKRADYQCSGSVQDQKSCRKTSQV